MFLTAAPLRTKAVAQTLFSTRTFATKSYVVKSTPAKASSSSTYVSRARATTRSSSVKSPYSAGNSTTANPSLDTATTTSAPVIESATTNYAARTSPLSFAPSLPAYAATPSTPSFDDFTDESSMAPGQSSSSSASFDSNKFGGDNRQGRPAPVFANNNNSMKDAVIGENGAEDGQDWSRSFSGMATEPFPKEVAEILMRPLDSDDIEIKPDGLLYLPEIKYRRILNKAFGPGGWGLAPRSEHSISPKTISREYALICRGRFVSTARGEQDYFDAGALATATEGCKSNALMRCCKDLGIASELWDPSFIRKFKKQYCEEQFVEHAVTKKKKKLWKRKDTPDFEYPYSKAKF